MHPAVGRSQSATFRDKQVHLDGPVDWPSETRLIVSPAKPPPPRIGSSRGGNLPAGHVIIAGFGLAGRFVADLLDDTEISYTIVEKNPATVETQAALGRRIVGGDITQTEVLHHAGLVTAAILALTIPDEDAVLSAITVARRLRPEIYIIARTTYASKGMEASQLGADEVIKAEHAVAIQFYERLSRRIATTAVGTPGAVDPVQ